MTLSLTPTLYVFGPFELWISINTNGERYEEFNTVLIQLNKAPQNHIHNWNATQSYSYFCLLKYN